MNLKLNIKSALLTVLGYSLIGISQIPGVQKVGLSPLILAIGAGIAGQSGAPVSKTDK